MRSTDQAGRENRFRPRSGLGAPQAGSQSRLPDRGGYGRYSGARGRRCSWPALSACLAILGTAFTWAKPAMRWTRAPYDA